MALLKPLCHAALIGGEAILAASQTGLTCEIPYTDAEIQALRDTAAEQCRASVQKWEDFYHASWTSYMTAEYWIETKQGQTDQPLF
jgi:hypothetical protein